MMPKSNIDFTIKIDESLCDLCEDCIDVCPEQCYSKNVDGEIIWDNRNCTRCELCDDICKAITTKFEVQ